MSGIDSWAIVDPSENSTIPWITDCGCTTTSIRSSSTSNSSRASMTSRPLFMSVELSTVIFGPIDHVGWASASATVTRSSSAFERPRKGPPLAVRRIRSTASGGPAWRAW